jgi:hypothetical protein
VTFSMPVPRTKRVIRVRQIQEYRIQCGSLTLTTKRGSRAWIAAIDGPDVKYLAIKMDEVRAKKACIEVATTILKRRGAPIPNCLIKPVWIPV